MKDVKSKRFSFSILSDYRSIFMGLAIISILIFHYTDDCRIYHYHFSGWVKYYNTFISSSGVDLFLLLSGFGLYYSFKKNNQLEQFYKKRFVKILIPYFVFCLPALIWKYMIFGNESFLVVLKQFSFYSFFTNGDRWFWYICMICICYYFFPYLFHFIDNERDSFSMKFLGICSFLLLGNVLLSLYYRSLFINIEIMTLRFLAFVIGVFFGKLSYDKVTISFHDMLSILFVLIGCFFLRYSKNIMFVRYSCFAFLLFLLLLFILFLRIIYKSSFFRVIKSILEKIGEYTLELYLTHVCFRTVLCSYGYYTCRIRYYLFVVIFSIIVSIPLKKICNVLSKRILNT